MVSRWAGEELSVGVGVEFLLSRLKGVPPQVPKQEEQLRPGPGTARAAQTTGRSARYKVTVFSIEEFGAAHRQGVSWDLLSLRYLFSVWGREWQTDTESRGHFCGAGILLLPGTGSLGGTQI